MPLRARNFWPHSSIKSLVAPQRAHNFGHHSSSSFAVPCRVSHRPAASPVAGAGDSGRVRPLGWQEPRLNPLPSTTPKTAQKHSSCLSETPLYERTGFCVKFARAPTLGGPRLIAWSQPSPHRQHRQHRRRNPIYMSVLHLPPHAGGSPSPQGRRARRRDSRGSPLLLGRQRSGPNAVDAASKKDISDYVLRNGGEDARRINSCL